jgi:AcrR family transcriptional regulator
MPVGPTTLAADDPAISQSDLGVQHHRPQRRARHPVHDFSNRTTCPITSSGNMDTAPGCHYSERVTATTAPKALRADARHNYDALVAAGKSVFARAGTDAPLEDVGREAGVGRGTLYRHFPTREHLFAAIMQERVDDLDTRAKQLLDAPDAWSALTEWLRLYDRSATDYLGMSARVGNRLADDESPVAAACAPMKKSFGRLYRRAQREADVRSDLTAVELLAMISALPKPAPGARRNQYLEMVLRALRS